MAIQPLVEDEVNAVAGGGDVEIPGYYGQINCSGAVGPAPSEVEVPG